MSDSVQQIKDKLSILDVVSPYVELHKAGKNFKGKSPFAAEKTPSFYVSPDRGMYYCFSTSQGGDIFNFMQVMEGVDFKEALKILAQKAGVELVPEDPKKKSERERLFSALEAATVFYSDWLQKEPEAAAYLQQRGVKPETIAKWRIGFAPGPPKYGWRDVKIELENQAYTKEELLKAGLIKHAEGGKEPFDVFRDRIMFPMAEPNGKVVAFSGRILHPDDRAPKYVNSPETELYKKSDLLFGYDKAKTGIRNLNFSLIVEGQFDVVMCHQAGYLNTVAVSGTALTLHHVQLLERLSDKVVLALDADRAGINAMKRGAQLMLSRGLDVKVAELPLGKDPADIIQADASEFKKVIGQSVHVIEFLLHVLRREVAEDRIFRQKVQQEIYPFVLLLPSRTEQYSFAEVIAKYIEVPIDIVWHEIERLREQKSNAAAVESAKPQVSEQAAAPEKITSVPQKAYIFLRGAEQVVDADLAKKLAAALTEIATIGELAEVADADIAGVVFTLEQQFAQLPAQAVCDEVVAKLNQLKTSLIRRQLAGLRATLNVLADAPDDEQLLATLELIRKLETSLRESAYQVEDFIKVD